jgi:hypothetical protein
LTISNRPGTASPVKGKLRQRLTRLPEALLLTVPMLFGAACAAAIQQDTERMLGAAGFRMRPADAVGVDSCGVPRPSLAPYVAGTGAARG